MGKASTAVMVQAKDAINDMFVGIGVHNERHTPKIEGPVVTALGNASQALRNAIEKENAKPDVTKFAPDEDIVSFMEGVIGCVEANSFEMSSLWSRNKEIGKREWVENGGGYLKTVGRLDDRPVAISLRTAIIDGQKILFYYATSQVVDHDMICEWLLTYLPETAKGSYPGGYNHTDATNFHTVFRRK